MKIIEAMKKVKMNLKKISDLNVKIKTHCAHLSIESNMYGNPTKQVKSWLQSCEDISKENINLLCRIQKTNMATDVSIELGGKSVSNTIAYWVLRRRDYANIDAKTWGSLGNSGKQGGEIQNTTGGEATKIEIVYNYDVLERDEKMGIYRDEPFMIDSTLEVINATTELVD